MSKFNDYLCFDNVVGVTNATRNKFMKYSKHQVEIHYGKSYREIKKYE